MSNEVNIENAYSLSRLVELWTAWNKSNDKHKSGKDTYAPKRTLWFSVVQRNVFVFFLYNA